MIRSLFFGLLLTLPQLIIGQHHYEYDLELLNEGKKLKGQAVLTFHNKQDFPLDTIPLHLPPRALEWDGSFFHQQYSEFQKVDLHFARPEETGSIQLSSIQLAQWEYEACQDCEFANLALKNSLETGDSIQLSFSLEIYLPQKDWLGSYSSETDIRIIDWLPRFPTLDSNGFHPYPLTWQRDVYPSKDSYEVDLQLPGNFIVASNASLQTKSELKRLEVLKARPFGNVNDSSDTKQLHYEHRGTNLQFILSRNFYVFPLQGGGNLYLQRKDPFMPSILDTINGRISNFMKSELGEPLTEGTDIVLLDNKKVEYQSDHMLSLSYPGNAFQLARELAQARFEAHFRYRMAPNGFENVWLARGLPYYYKYHFIETKYPEEFWSPLQDVFTGAFWQPFVHKLAGWVLGLDNFNYSYQNQYLYLFLARQGLDQEMSAPADSLTRLNYEGAAQAKSYLAFHHLREFCGERPFKRAMHDYTFLKRNYSATPKSLEHSFAYYKNRDVSWFFDRWIHSTEIYDFRLKNYDHCPTISTATIKNKGRLNIPFSITGYKDEEPVLTEWFEGHEGKKSLQIYHEDYDYLSINAHNRNAEWNQKDNAYTDRWLFPQLKPLKIQFYQSLEDPNATQIYWFPAVSYNAYDRWLLRMDLYNYGFVTRKWEWYVGPSYSTGQNQLTGAGSLEYNHIPKANSIFHRISGGIYARYYHYDEDLAYYRISPGINFRFRKPYPRSTILQRIRLRSVHLERELSEEFEGVANDISNASYSVVNLTHRYEETRILQPYTIKTDLMVGDQFSRLSAEADFRWMLPNKRWLIWRSFGGVFFTNEFADLGQNQNYYSLGLSGTQDFMFDYPFIGRSDQTGIWSQQFFVTDGGFKSQTGVFADQWMLTSNLNLPIWKAFGLFGDVGLADDFDQLYYDYGIRIALLSDFFEVYFPVANHQSDFISQANYSQNVRYILNLDLEAILHRLRRGYY